MKYMIYCAEKKMYYSYNKDSHWTEDKDCSAHFNTIDSAQSVISSQLRILNLKLEIYSLDGELQENQMSIENPEEVVKELHNVIDLFSDSVKNINRLIEYYSNQLSYYDGAQEDILHKVEFDTVIGVEAVRLMKKLKEIRLARRKVKDNLMFLTSLRDNKANMLGDRMVNFQKNLENRKYKPRALKELFE